MTPPVHESAHMLAEALPPIAGGTHVCSTGALSELQRDTAARALAAVTTGRRVFFLADGNGMGKTRVTAAVLTALAHKRNGLFVLWLVPYRCGHERIRAAIDLVGGLPLMEVGQCDSPYKRRSLTGATVVKIMTYDEMRLHGRAFEQTCRELSTAQEKLLILDDAHVAKAPHSAAHGTVSELQRRLPRAMLLYVTDTPAARVADLGYMHRLGLFGPGSEFASHTAFVQAMRKAPALVGYHLKSRGLYVRRTLGGAQPLRGPDLRVRLTGPQTRLYDACLKLWRQDDPGKLSLAQATAGHRFFTQLLVCFKAEAIAAWIHQAISEGWSVVVSVDSPHRGKSCRDLLGSRETNLQLPSDPLDILFTRLHQAAGVGPVSELTPRRRRRERRRGGLIEVARTDKDCHADVLAFQRGQTHVALLSVGARAEVQLHANRDCTRPRVHLLLHIPKPNTTAAYHVGRTNRMGQTHAPLYRVVVATDVFVDEWAGVDVATHLDAIVTGHTTYSVEADSRKQSIIVELMAREVNEALAGHGVSPTTVPRITNVPTDKVVAEQLAYAADMMYSGVPVVDNRGTRILPPHRVTRLTHLMQKVGTLFPNLPTGGAPLSWRFSNHMMFGRASRRVAETVLLCAGSIASQTAIRVLSPELLERVLAFALDDGWELPATEVCRQLLATGMSRQQMSSSTIRSTRLFTQGASMLSVTAQRTLWSAATRAPAVTTRLESPPPELHERCYRGGIPIGCEMVCVEKECYATGIWTLVTELRPRLDIGELTSRAFRVALQERRVSVTPPVRPTIVVRHNDTAVRLATVLGDTVLVWAPAREEPVCRFPLADWESHRYQLPGIAAKQLEGMWNAEARQLADRRAYQCRNSRMMVKLVGVLNNCGHFGTLVRLGPPIEDRSRVCMCFEGPVRC